MECNWDEEGDGNSTKGGGQATAMATKWAMAMATSVVGNKEGNGNGSKNDGNGSKGGGRATATRAMVMRVAHEQRQQG